MAKIFKDIPIDGRVVSIREDTVGGGSFLFPRRELRTTLFIKNEAVGIKQPVSFIRPTQQGNILSTLINDFKEGKNIRITGKVSYFLIHPLFQVTVFGKKVGLPKETQKFVDVAAHLVGTKDWKLISESDRKVLGEFACSGAAVFSETNCLRVSVDGEEAKYTIRVIEKRTGADIYLQQSKK
ncbi:MAG: hypothetical protein ABH841_00905 [Candidatus Nealsonbacteria bacterium]